MGEIYAAERLLGIDLPQSLELVEQRKTPKIIFPYPVALGWRCRTDSMTIICHRLHVLLSAASIGIGFRFVGNRLKQDGLN